jgi:hypothetical protein
MDPLQKAATNVMSALLEKTKAVLRNHGRTPGDRALNFLGTNLVHRTELTTSPVRDWDVNDAILAGLEINDSAPSRDELASYLYTLGNVVVSKSPVDRLNGDCWDIKLIFFNPAHPERAKMCYVFTLDVSDQLPVVLPGMYRFIAAG